MTTKLKAAIGTDEANVGTTDYKIPPDRIIEVADDEVGALIARGGFSVVVDPVAIPDGLVIMKAPTDDGGCTFEGIAYTPDAGGIVSVPVAAVSALIAHGYTIVAG